MEYDVVIPTWKGEKYIEALLRKVFSQSVPPKNVFVVDSSSPDSTAEVARGLGANVTVIDQKDFNHGGTRNFAAHLGTSEVIVFLTQDALPAGEDTLPVLVKSLQSDSDVAMCYSRQIAYEDADPPEVFARNFNYPEESEYRDGSTVVARGIRAYFCSNVCSAVRRDVFVELGGFPEDLPMNEDMVYCAMLFKSGHKVAYISDSIVMHSHNYTLKQQAKRYFDIGAFMCKQGHLLPGARAGGEGFRFARGQVVWLLKKGFLLWALRSPFEVLAKYVSYKFGKNYGRLPRWLVRRWAMHSGYYE